MGQEARCTVRFGDRVLEGKALLETDEIVFRGEHKLRILFKEMRSVKAIDGDLRIDWADGTAIFHLAGQAEKWAQKILNPKGLLDKLGVKPEMRVSVVGVEDKGFLRDLRARTEDVREGEVARESDYIFVQVDGAPDMERISELKSRIKPNGAIWAVFRKGRKDFNENDVLRGGLAAGLVDVKVVRFSDTHTASKFVIRVADRQ